MKIYLTLFGVGLLNIMYMLGSLIFVGHCELVHKTSSFDESFSEICIHNISMIKGIRVILFGLDPSDDFIRKIMSLGTSTIIEFKSQSEFPSFDCDEDIPLDFLIVIKTKHDKLNSTHLVIPTNCLAYERSFFIYKIANGRPSKSGKGCFLCLHTSNYVFSQNLIGCCTEYSLPSTHDNCISPLCGNPRRNHLEHRGRWPDMMGKTIEVVTFHRPIATIIHQNQSDLTKRYDGLEMNIFIEITKRLNLTWQVNELEGELDKWGQLLKNGSWRGGIMEALTSGTAEVGFSTLWMAPLQMPYLDYTNSWTSISSTFLVPRPTAIGISWESLVRPFTLSVWRVFALSLLLFPISVWATARLHILLTHENKEIPSLDSYMVYTLGSITGGSGVLSKGKELPVRIIVSWWYVFILLLCNSYTSKIMASLTLPSYTSKINSVQQLVEQHIHWGRQYREDDLSKHLDFEKYWHRQFASNFIVYNITHLRTMLMSRRFALTIQQIESCDHLFMDDAIDDEIADNFRVMKEKIRSYRCAIALRKHSPLLPFFNAVMERLIETGLVQYFKEDAVRRFQSPAYKRITIEIDQGIRSKEIAALTLENYKFMFYLYFFGLLVSTGCFLIELNCKNL